MFGLFSKTAPGRPKSHYGAKVSKTLEPNLAGRKRGEWLEGFIIECKVNPRIKIQFYPEKAAANRNCYETVVLDDDGRWRNYGYSKSEGMAVRKGLHFFGLISDNDLFGDDEL